MRTETLTKLISLSMICRVAKLRLLADATASAHCSSCSTVSTMVRHCLQMRLRSEFGEGKAGGWIWWNDKMVMVEWATGIQSFWCTGKVFRTSDSEMECNHHI